MRLIGRCACFETRPGYARRSSARGYLIDEILKNTSPEAPRPRVRFARSEDKLDEASKDAQRSFSSMAFLPQPNGHRMIA
jgi:hypothetical protein